MLVKTCGFSAHLKIVIGWVTVYKDEVAKEFQEEGPVNVQLLWTNYWSLGLFDNEVATTGWAEVSTVWNIGDWYEGIMKIWLACTMDRNERQWRKSHRIGVMCSLFSAPMIRGLAAFIPTWRWWIVQPSNDNSYSALLCHINKSKAVPIYVRNEMMRTCCITWQGSTRILPSIWWQVSLVVYPMLVLNFDHKQPSRRHRPLHNDVIASVGNNLLDQSSDDNHASFVFLNLISKI